MAVAGHVVRRLPANVFQTPKVRQHLAGRNRARTVAEDKVRHQFVWHSKAWVCKNCGCFKKGVAGKVDRRSCGEAARAIGLAHPSHSLYRAWEGCVPLVFCNHCGVDSSTKAVVIKAPCVRGRGKATILRRLRMGVHPVARHVLHGTQKVHSLRTVGILARRAREAGWAWGGEQVSCGPSPIEHTRRRLRAKTKPGGAQGQGVRLSREAEELDWFPEVGCCQVGDEVNLEDWLDEGPGQSPDSWEF